MQSRAIIFSFCITAVRSTTESLLHLHAQIDRGNALPFHDLLFQRLRMAKRADLEARIREQVPYMGLPILFHFRGREERGKE